MGLERGITLGLLCGGQGSRLGGPKEQLRDALGQTLLEYQLRRTEGQFPNRLVLSGSDGKAFLADSPSTAFTVVPDPPPHAGKGPMAGLLAGLRSCPTDWLALMPIDCPSFPPEAFAETLVRAGHQRLAVGWIDHEDRFQWLPGLYHRDLCAALEQSLERDELRFGRWVKAQPRAFVPWTHPQVAAGDAFANLNTPEQAALAGFRLPDSFTPRR